MITEIIIVILNGLMCAICRAPEALE